MSSIVFEGNTYTFGATVSANSGTGTTSYVFGGLSSGWTYGFIIWAFNGVGPSSIVGPVTRITFSDEFRESINIFSFGYQGLPIYWDVYPTWTTRNTENLISPSEGILTDTNDSRIKIETGFSGPFGGTGAMRLTTNIQFQAPKYATSARTTFIPVNPGQTYYLSYWTNVDFNRNTYVGLTDRLGVTLGNFNGQSPYLIQQIEPTVGGTANNVLGIVYPGGITGWKKFSFRIIPGPTANNLFLTFPWYAGSTVGGVTMFFWGLQFDTGNSSGTGPKNYLPNIEGPTYASSNIYSDPLGTGTIYYDASPETVATNSITKGYSYYWPLIQITPNSYPQANVNRSWSVINLDASVLYQGLTANPLIKYFADCLKLLDSKKRGIRPNPLDNNGIFVNYNDSITNPNGVTNSNVFYYVDDQMGSTTSNIIYLGGMWPDRGITGYRIAFKNLLKEFANQGATIGIISFDNESTPFGPNAFIQDTSGYGQVGWTGAQYVLADPRYTQPWQGISSRHDYFTSAGGNCWSDLVGNEQYSDRDGQIWFSTDTKYQARGFELAMQEGLCQYAPNANVSNYSSYYLEPLEYGITMGTRGIIGNNASPVLYGEVGNKNVTTQYYDSTRLNSGLETSWILNRFNDSENVLRDSSNWSTSGVTFTYGITNYISPTPNILCSKLTENVTPSFGDHNLSQGGGYGVQGITNYVYSVYMKKPDISGRTYAAMRLGIQSGSSFGTYTVMFNLTNGTTSSQTFAGVTLDSVGSGIIPAGNSWYRCWLTGKGTVSGSNVVKSNIFMANGPSVTSNLLYAGDGVSELLLSSHQLEYGTTPTTYYPKGIGTSLTTMKGWWISFMYCLQSVRSAKRGSYNTPLTPWITNPGSPVLDNSSYFNSTASYPINGFSDVVQGFNPQYGITFTNEGGNSAYYKEMVQHTALHGVQYFNMWTSALFIDVRTGSQSAVDYFRAGLTSHEREISFANNSIAEVNDRIKGFTLTTADTSRISWLAPYIASGAPGPKGTTWWWRITVNPGNTVLVNGYTLNGACGPWGTWVSTTGPTLAYVPITVL